MVRIVSTCHIEKIHRTPEIYGNALACQIEEVDYDHAREIKRLKQIRKRIRQKSKKLKGTLLIPHSLGG